MILSDFTKFFKAFLFFNLFPYCGLPLHLFVQAVMLWHFDESLDTEVTVFGLDLLDLSLNCAKTSFHNHRDLLPSLLSLLYPFLYITAELLNLF